MNDLLKTRLFSLLSELSQVTNEEMQNAYGCFMEQLRTVSKSETDYLEVYRILHTTRAELAFLKSLYRHEKGGKCPEIRVSTKSVRPCQF